MNRLDSLDWLRGLLALSIMIYHLTGWKLYEPDAGGLLGRLGIYGVSMFFILSGLSMANGYSRFIRDGRSSVRFFVRRIFRIWPLLWIAVGAVTAGNVLMKGQSVDWTLVFLNLTTLFGFISPGAYINTGAWSIGNEMVYYALTPAFVIIYSRNILYGNMVVAATIAIALYFGFWAISEAETLESQWQTYINPFNNLFLYCTGLALYYNTHKIVLSTKTTLSILLISIALIAFYPASGDLVSIVTGANRIAFFLASTLLVFSFYKLKVRLPRVVSHPLTALGVATYGVYLLHPIVYPFVELCIRKLGMVVGPYWVMGMTVTLTIAAALVLYHGFEAPLIRLGKRVTASAASSSPEGKKLGPSGNV